MLRLTVRVHPRASRDRLVWDGRTLDLWVHQPPVDGAANDAVERAVAGWLGVAPSAVRVSGGRTSRTKLVDVSADVTPPVP